MKPINDIPISQIIPGKNDRTIFDESGLRELADSIKEHGLIQPITVRYVKDFRQFEIIAGERRFRACKLLGWQTAQNYRLSRHVAGGNFSYYGYGSIFPLSGLQFTYMSCKDKTHSRRLEADCLWDYRKTKGYIDLLPLNFSGGKAD
jgi:hypothetical protein